MAMAVDFLNIKALGSFPGMVATNTGVITNTGANTGVIGTSYGIGKLDFTNATAFQPSPLQYDPYLYIRLNSPEKWDLISLLRKLIDNVVKEDEDYTKYLDSELGDLLRVLSLTYLRT